MNIHEITNKAYVIEPIKMANDSIIKNCEPPLPCQYGFFMICVGRPGSGKSTFWINMINKRSKNTFYKKFDKVYIFSNSLHTITSKIKLPDDRLFNGIDELETVIEDEKKGTDKILVILDDVISDIKDTDFFLKLLYNRRHIAGSVSIIITTQVYNKLKLPLRKVATHLVLFNTSNKKEFDSIFQDFINLKRETFDDIVRYVFKDSHDFLFINTVDNIFYRNFNRLEFDEK